MNRVHFACAAWCVLATVLICVPAKGQHISPKDVPSIEWLTGSKLRKTLGLPVSVAWSGAPLRQSLIGLGQRQRVAVFIDRRVDPDQPLELTLDQVPLGQAFEKAAESCKLGLAWFGAVVYVGPPQAASGLRTLAAMRAAEAQALAAKDRRALAQSKALQWPDFSSPRDLLAALAHEGGWKLGEAERVPHDLWASADLPPLSLADRITIVASQFDLSFRLDSAAGTLVLVPSEREPGIERSYPAGTNPERRMQDMQRLVPNGHVELKGGRLQVRGLVEDHDRIQGIKPYVLQPPPRLSETRYTLTYREKPLRALLDQLEKQIHVELRLDAKALQLAGISLDQNVDLAVNQASLDELLKAALSPAGLAFTREGLVVEIYPATADGDEKSLPPLQRGD